MFQSINGQVGQSKNGEAREKISKVMINIFDKKYVALYIISFMISTISISEDTSIFGISLLAACFSNTVPLIGIVIAGIIGNCIKFGLEGAVSYILMMIVMVASFYILKPKYNDEDKNEKFKIAKNIFIATFVVQISKAAIGVLTIYDGLFAITFSVLSVVFYKIFVNALVILEDIRENRAFSIEEVIGASLLLAITVSAFGEGQILGFSIRNVLSILIVLVLGWKNGILVGATSGVTIGVTIGIITGGEPIIIAAYAISGMIAGLLNKFGKIGVVVGFLTGNVVLAYASNGYSVEVIYLKEILIASIALFVIPKHIKIDIEEFTGAKNLLPLSMNRGISTNRQTVDKLNNVTDTLNQMIKTFNSEDLSGEIKDQRNKQGFISQLLNSVPEKEFSPLYEEIGKPNSLIASNIYELLLENQEIDKENLILIYKKCNTTVEALKKDVLVPQMHKEINKMVKSINTAYEISKNNIVCEKKIEDNKNNLKTQLEGVSSVINTIAQDIKKDTKQDGKYLKETAEVLELLRQKEILVKEIVIKKETRFLIDISLEQYAKLETIEDVLTKVLAEKIVINNEVSKGKELVFLSDDHYIMALAEFSEAKHGQDVSGDSLLKARLRDGKYVVALSDGMGSGVDASKSSKETLKMLEKLVLTGFNKKSSVDLITTSLINRDEEMFSTLDMAIVDLYAGKVEFIKSGACPTYIKNKNKVQIIKSSSLPLGIVNKENTNIEVFDKNISEGEIMLMCTDGVLEANVEYTNKELWVKYLLEDIETTNTKKIADLIKTEAIDNNYGKAKDDMSMIVCKFVAKDV